MECKSVLLLAYRLSQTNTNLRFVLAKLQIDFLMSQPTLGDIKLALQDLCQRAKGPDMIYEQVVERIEGQGAGFRELAKQVLSWITCAKRPLTTLELQHALAVEVGELALDEDNLPEIEDVISVCAGLVTVDEESNIIRLVHYTAQEYFQRTQISWFPNAQRDIAASCITYLLFDVFETGFCATDKEFEARLQLNPLYDYAARNWGYHAYAALTDVDSLTLKLLKNEGKASAATQAMMASGSHSGYSQDMPRKITGLHLAAYFGLRDVMVDLLTKGQDPNLKDSNGQTPLSWASANGHEAVVKLLLATKDVDPDSKDSRSGRTSLSWAAGNGHEAAARQLLAAEDVDPNSMDNDSRTPLSWAAASGHEAVAKLLLQKDGVDPDSMDNDSQTPLSWQWPNCCSKRTESTRIPRISMDRLRC
jgi:hypothetical protein